MRKWRIIVGIFVVVLFLATMNVAGFHEAGPTYTAITIVGLAVITCVCDATKAVLDAIAMARDSAETLAAPVPQDCQARCEAIAHTQSAIK